MEFTNPFKNAKLIGENVPNADYRKQDGMRGDPNYAMSRSDLVEFNRCPHRWRAGYERKDTDATDWGSIMDVLFLQPNRFNDEYAVAPATYTNEKGEEKPWNWNAKVCQQWRDEREGKAILKADQYTEAKQSIEVLAKDTTVAELMFGAKFQVMVVGEYDCDGVIIPVKALIDIVPSASGQFPKSLADFKTTTSAALHSWKRSVFDYGYHTQAAMHLDLYTAATGEDRVDFRHVLQENYVPWEVGRRVLSEEFIQLGRTEYLSALKRYAACLKSNVWPSYDEAPELNGFSLTDPEAWMVKTLFT